MPTDGLISPGIRFETRLGGVQDVPNRPVRGHGRRVHVHDHTAVRGPRHENDGPDHRHVDHVLDRIVQVVLPGRVPAQVPDVPSAFGQRSCTGHRRLRSGRAPLHFQSPAADENDQQPVRAQRLLPHRFPIVGCDDLISKRVPENFSLLT